MGILDSLFDTIHSILTFYSIDVDGCICFEVDIAVEYFQHKRRWHAPTIGMNSPSSTQCNPSQSSASTNMPQLRSRAESLDIIQSFLAGNLSPPNASRRFKRGVANPSVSHALGVTLRAASRQKAGKSISSFEQHLIDIARIVVPEDQLHEFSHAYDQAAPKLKNSRNAVFSKQLLNLPDEPYTQEDFVRDMAELAGDDLSSVVETVDASKLQAVDQNGESAVGHVGNPDALGTRYIDSSRKRDSKVNASRYVRINLHQFHTIKSSGETPGPKDEIYWCYGVAADGGNKNSFKTKTFGQITDDTWTFFDSSTTLFSGYVSDNVEAHIEVWEEDDSSSKWVDALKDLMLRISEECLKTAREVQSLSNPTDKQRAFLNLVGLCTYLVGTLVSLIRNDDDLVRERTFSWDMSYINSNMGGYTYERFDGRSVGTHDLTLRWDSS
jgi:hypothetical protein